MTVQNCISFCSTAGRAWLLIRGKDAKKDFFTMSKVDLLNIFEVSYCVINSIFLNGSRGLIYRRTVSCQNLWTETLQLLVQLKLAYETSVPGWRCSAQKWRAQEKNLHFLPFWGSLFHIRDSALLKRFNMNTKLQKTENPDSLHVKMWIFVIEIQV